MCLLGVSRPGSGGTSSEVEADEDRDFRRYFHNAMSEATGEGGRVLVLCRRCERYFPPLETGVLGEETRLENPWMLL